MFHFRWQLKSMPTDCWICTKSKWQNRATVPKHSTLCRDSGNDLHACRKCFTTELADRSILFNLQSDRGNGRAILQVWPISSSEGILLHRLCTWISVNTVLPGEVRINIDNFRWTTYFHKPVLPPPLIVFSWFHYFQMWIYAIYKNGWSNVNMSEQFHKQIDKLRRPRHSMRRNFLPAVELHNTLKNIGKGFEIYWQWNRQT